MTPTHAANPLGELKASPFFHGLAPEQLARLARAADVRTYAPGELIAAENEPVSGFFLVLSGQAKLFKLSPEGREQTIYIFRAGEPFCLCTLFGASGWPANAAAMDECRILRIEGRTFETMARSEPQLLLDLLHLLSGRLKEAMDLIEALSLKDIPARVAAFLLHEARDLSGADRLVSLPVSHRELAKIVGVTPEALSRAMRRMKEAGLVEVNGREVTLIDPAGLARCAESGLAPEPSPLPRL